MKISKVNNVRVGVSNEPEQSNENKHAKGILYDFPGKDESIKKDVKAHVKELNEKNKELYHILITKNEQKYNRAIKSNVTFVEKRFLEKINSTLNESGKNETDAVNVGVSYLKNFKVKPLKQDKKIIEDQCKQLISTSLRQSLRKTFKIDGKQVYLPDVICDYVILICTADQKAYKNTVESDAWENKLKLMVEVITHDYCKQNKLEQIKKSIENQNVKVQVADTKLKPAGAVTGKKEILFTYLCEFASGDEKKQNEMLQQFRALVRMYLGVYDKEDYYSMSAHNLKKNNKSFNRDFKAQYTAALWDDYYAYYTKAKAQCTSQSLMGGNDNYVEYWLGYISDYVKNHVVNKSYMLDDKVNKKRYIAENVVKQYRSFLCGKYIDMGKAVYHFAMDDLQSIGKESSGKKQYNFGQVSQQYKNGLTSFDYERIKAVDSFERNVTTYITFAINNFQNGLLKANSMVQDILSIHNKEDFEKFCNADSAKKIILAYFGGESSWSSSEELENEPFELFSQIKIYLSNIRNSTFHYTASVNKKIQNNKDIIKTLFDGENVRLKDEYKKKYYSNNVFLYYNEEDVNGMVNEIYQNNAVIPAQIPSFNKVLSRPLFRNFCKEKFLKDIDLAKEGIDDYEKFRSSLYFIFKEIYYHDFLLQDGLSERFTEKFADIIKEEKGNQKRKAAVTNFNERLDILTKKKYSFAQICQDIMTVYNQQNNQIQEKLSGKDREKKGIYQHYPMLLYRTIREAFFDYLEEKYQFLKSPKQLGGKSIAEINWSQITINPYSGVEASIQEDWLKSWYVVVHFLPPKQLNLLKGTIKKYIQFMEDIKNREDVTGNSREQSFKKENYNKIIEIIDFVMNFSGKISPVITDYYENEEDYAKKLANYVDFVDKNNNNSLDKQLKLYESGKGVYYDDQNPIVNRNIVMAKLYGTTGIIVPCYKKITNADFTNLGNLKNKLLENNVFENGICNTKSDQINLKKYTDIKNHIELVDVLTYSELMNDFMSHLISWCILRERDLMYFQLGIYYMKLFHTKTIPEDSFLRKLDVDDNIQIENGAVLYQIVSMYTYELPIYTRKKEAEKEKVIPEKNVSTGKKVSSFVTGYCGCGDKSQDETSEKYYMYGLQLFESLKEHDNLIKFRNYIDHFKYYKNNDVSMLDLYSTMFNSFLKYDLKLQKSVPVVITNILMNYFIKTQLDISLDERESEGQTSKKAIISINKDATCSDEFVCKNSVYDKKLEKYIWKKSISIKARDKNFIECVLKMLEYKNEKTQNDEE